MQFAASISTATTEVLLMIRVHIVPAAADTPPGGTGKPGAAPFAPALMNAILAASGMRIQALPIGKRLGVRNRLQGRPRGQ